MPVPRVLLRDLIIPLISFTSVFLLPERWFVAAFLAVGQAHFALALLSQYRAGKVTKRYLLIGSAVALMVCAYFAFSGGFYPIFLVAACLFGIHFALDEFFLHGEDSSDGRVLTVASFTALYFSLILYTSSLPHPALPLAAGAWFFSVIAVRCMRTQFAVSAAERYLWLVGALLAVLVVLSPVQAQTLLALVILLHCFNWYIDYGRKLADRGDAVRLARYWREVAVSLIISFALYFLYVRLSIPMLSIAFLPMYYDGWALAHFALSMRLPRPG